MKSIITAVALAALATLTATAQKGIDNPMTRAVLAVYEQQLKDDPTDYETWMNRANEYYTHSEYMRALNDVDNALKYIPAGDKDTRLQAYMLRANIYEQTGRLQQALDDFNSALALDPTSYVGTYQRANVEYELGQYNQARIDYKRLQAMNPRSAEALIGLARVAVKENNLGTANELLDQAVNLDPNNADYYVRRSSVRRSMGNDAGAVEDLILALSTDSNNARATRDLVDYGNANYAAVITGLTSAMEQAPRVGMFVYLRAVIAQAHYRYTAALADFKKIVDENLYDYHGIYASMAECQFALGRYNDALANVEHALAMQPDVQSSLVLKAQILRALGRADAAFEASLKASVVNPGTAVPIVEMGLCRAAQGNYAEAGDLFGEATLTDPASPMNFMLRAWMLEAHLNQPVAAKGFYEQVAQMEGFAPDNVRSLRGFALLFAGDTEGARAWMANILGTVADRDGFINYMAACLYAAAGDDDTALACVARSLDAGYANRYDWLDNNDGRINPGHLRDDLRFLQLIAKHSIIFGL